MPGSAAHVHNGNFDSLQCSRPPNLSPFLSLASFSTMMCDDVAQASLKLLVLLVPVSPMRSDDRLYQQAPLLSCFYQETVSGQQGPGGSEHAQGPGGSGHARGPGGSGHERLCPSARELVTH